MKNILVIRTHRFGDILQLTPLLGALKEAWPGCATWFLTGEDFVPLLEGNPSVDRIIPLPERLYRHWLKSRPERRSRIFNEIFDLVIQLREVRFDLVINRQYEEGALMAHLIGGKKIVGGAYAPGEGFLFSDKASGDLFNAIRRDRKNNRTNLADWACRIAGVPAGTGRQMSFPLKTSARRKAGRLLGCSRTSRPVAVQMGAARSFRQWGAENYLFVIRWLTGVRGRRVVLVGSADDAEMGRLVLDAPGIDSNRVVNLIGQTSLPELGAVLAACDMMITGDTGPMHLAAAVGTPVLSLFYGTAFPWETGPYGLGHGILYPDLACAPCLDPEACPSGHRCRACLTPSAVVEAIEALERYRQGETPSWSAPAAESVRLLVTGRDARGEQVLVRPEEAEPVRPCTGNPPRGNDEAEEIFRRGDEAASALLSGREERGYPLFAEYLETWAAFQGTRAGRGSDLIRACLRALEARDMVTLMDAVTYGFNPLLAQTSRNPGTPGKETAHELNP